MSLFSENFETLQRLIEEKKASAGEEGLREYVNSRDIFGDCPLHYQIEYRCVEALIKAGADVNSRDNHANTCLHRYSDFKCAEALIKAGADINAQNRYDNTPLHLQKNIDIIEALIKAGANVNIKNHMDWTPLNCPYGSCILVVYRSFMAKRLQSFCKRNFKYFVFKHWITSREGVEWLYHPRRGGKYVQRRMYDQLRSKDR